MTAITNSFMHVDEERLETDLTYRFNYLCGFTDFDGEDIHYIHASAPLLVPMIRSIVDSLYVKIYSYDVTRRHFISNPHYSVEDCRSTEDDLTLDDEQLRLRKSHLGNYLRQILTSRFDEKLVSYLDTAGQSPMRQFDGSEPHVPLVQMNVLMGYITDALLSAIGTLNLESHIKIRTMRAFSKLMWIQNDLIARHYNADRSLSGTIHENTSQAPR